MVCCGLGDPCHTPAGETVTGDSATEDMKKLFVQGYAKYPDKWITKAQVVKLVTDDPDLDLFNWWDLNDRGGQSSFGKKLRAFIGRELGGIKLSANVQDNHRPKFQFSRVGATPVENPVDGYFLRTTQAGCQLGARCQPEQPYSVSNNKQFKKGIYMYNNKYNSSGGVDVDKVCNVDIPTAMPGENNPGGSTVTKS